MPFFMLYIKADIEHIKSFRPHLRRFCVTLTSGSEERSGVWLDPSETYESPGGRSETNLVIRFEGAKQAATVDFVENSGQADCYSEDDSGQWVPIQCFECRGCEITSFSPQDDWVVVGESGQLFDEEVDLSEDWCDYDEGADVSPEISGFETKVERFNPPKKGGKKAKGKKNR
jgi:hypothetical protein